MKVLVAEPVNSTLDPLTGLDVVDRPDIWRDRPGLLAAIADCEGLVVRNQVRVDEELLASAPRLRAVGRLGAGLDNLHLAGLRLRHMEVMHGGGLNARAVAEYVIGSCFDLARGLAVSDRSVRAGRWERRPGIELKGRTLGVVGLGATGAETARLARAVGLEVRGFDPYLDPPAGVEKVDLDRLLSGSRFLTVHVPLTEQTRGLIGRRELALMPARSYVINAARGGVVDEAALLEALASGHLAGAALDVRVQEPMPTTDPLLGREDVLLTPHLAGLTEESQDAIARHVLSGLRSALDQGTG